MKRKILWLGVSFLLVAALVLASCGEAVPGQQEEEEEEEEPVGEQEEEEPVGEQEEEEEEEEEPVAGAPQYGGTLTYFQTSAEVDNPDPCSPTSELTKQLFSPILDGLVMLDFETYGPRGTGEWPFEVHELHRTPEGFWRGALAESWAVSPERITFQVRPGVYWAADNVDFMQNRELTAADVVFTLERWHVDWLDSGYFTENGGWIDDIYAEGKYTVVVETSRFARDWVRWLAGGESAIYPPEVEKAGITSWNNLVGTGPFMFNEYVVGSHMSFTRNPNYWGTTTINNKVYDDIPFVDELILPFVKDESTRIAALRTGKIDIYPRIPVKYEASLAGTNPDLEVLKALNNWQSLIALRCDAEPFNNKEVRQAMMIALDLPAMNKAAFYDGKLYPWLIAEWSPDFTPLAKQPPGAQLLYDYNPDLAIEMLADAGYPDGFAVTAIAASAGGEWSEGGRKDTDILEMAAGYWKAIGVELKINVLEPVAYSTARWEPYEGFEVLIDNVGNEGFFHPIEKHWAGWDPAPDEWLWNGSRLNNPEANKLFEQAMSTVDSAERDIIWRKAAAILFDEAAYISLGAPYGLTYWWPWVKNYYGEQYSSRSGIAHLMAAIWLDQGLKAEMGY